MMKKLKIKKIIVEKLDLVGLVNHKSHNLRSIFVHGFVNYKSYRKSICSYLVDLRQMNNIRLSRPYSFFPLFKLTPSLSPFFSIDNISSTLSVSPVRSYFELTSILIIPEFEKNKKLFFTNLINLRNLINFPKTTLALPMIIKN
ncbi:hypothetical protein BpHYR1_031994 [Brachionus plicatilis]|uniref:Uncharacterized protein n=1 Tax=Brachionus plicatilis TaxID=10195 RepID=A0A3M7SGK7_BRAPC|nr:hypothetical protein BpHYR1_031994 [Brachionus plicatilis]